MADKKTINKTFPILNMSCAACMKRVDKVLNAQKGVERAVVNFVTQTATVEYFPDIVSPEILQEAVRGAGYDMIISVDEEDTDELERAHLKKYRSLKRHTVWAISLAAPLMVISMGFPDMPYANIIMALLATPVVFWLGRSFFQNAWKQLKHRSANMDTLVALSTGIAYLFSLFNLIFPELWLTRGIEPHVYFEAAAVIIAFILLGRLLEERAKGRTSDSLKKLIGLQPKTVLMIDSEGQLTEAPINRVKAGDILAVRPGERIAVDGTVTAGSSYVDESMLSGEPLAVQKNIRAKVYAGTVNQKGSFNFCVDKAASETVLAQIIKMVKDAQESKAPVQKLVDKIAAVFVPVIISVSLLSLLLWILLDPVNGITHGILAMVTVLIVACPCALGLATPTAITVGIGKGAENGILIKDAKSLEIAKDIDTVILDKTGTITAGHPAVTDMLWLNGNDSLKEALYNLEKVSEHPIAEAITDYLGETPRIEIEDFRSITGKGVVGTIGGKPYYAGSLALMLENGVSMPESLAPEYNRLLKESKTVIVFSESRQVVAVVGVSDRVKESSIEAIAEMKSMGIKGYMLTGDNEVTAKDVASKVGIDNYVAEMLPQDKGDFVKKLQAEGRKIAMVGDGINDSAALAQADLGIAMGDGSDIAIDVAKITIVSSDLLKIPKAIRLSRQIVKTIRENLFWAFIYNLISIPIAAGLLYPVNGFLLNPMIAGAAMALSSVSVVTNSLRLKNRKI